MAGMALMDLAKVCASLLRPVPSGPQPSPNSSPHQDIAPIFAGWHALYWFYHLTSSALVPVYADMNDKDKPGEKG